MWYFLRNFKVFLVGFLIVIIAGCGSSSLDLMQSYYDKGRYLDAAEYAIDAIQEPEFQEEVELFFKDHGTELMDKIFVKGDSLVKDPIREEGVDYFQALSKVLGDMVRLEVNIEGLDGYVQRANQSLESAVSNYVDAHYQAGVLSFERQLYRRAIGHWELVLPYSPDYQDVVEYLSLANHLARRSISVIPTKLMFKHSSEPYGGSSRSIFKDRYQDRRAVFAQSHYVDQLGLTDYFNTELFQYLHARKSRFLSFSLDDRLRDVSVSDYYVQSEGDVWITQSPYDGYRYETEHIQYSYRDENGVERWDSADVRYKLYTMDYRIKVALRTDLLITSDNIKVSSVSATGEAFESVSYRDVVEGVPSAAALVHYSDEFLDIPTSPHRIDRTRVLQAALEDASDKLSRKILSVLDEETIPIP